MPFAKQRKQRSVYERQKAYISSSTLSSAIKMCLAITSCFFKLNIFNLSSSSQPGALQREVLLISLVRLSNFLALVGNYVVLPLASPTFSHIACIRDLHGVLTFTNRGLNNRVTMKPSGSLQGVLTIALESSLTLATSELRTFNNATDNSAALYSLGCTLAILTRAPCACQGNIPLINGN